MLNLNESFAGLRILSLVSKPSFHREVYEAQAPSECSVPGTYQYWGAKLSWQGDVIHDCKAF